MPGRECGCGVNGRGIDGAERHGWQVLDFGLYIFTPFSLLG